jgi:hypothetical protein
MLSSQALRANDSPCTFTEFPSNFFPALPYKSNCPSTSILTNAYIVRKIPHFPTRGQGSAQSNVKGGRIRQRNGARRQRTHSFTLREHPRHGSPAACSHSLRGCLASFQRAPASAAEMLQRSQTTSTSSSRTTSERRAARIAGCGDFAGAGPSRVAGRRGMRVVGEAVCRDRESLDEVEQLLRIDVEFHRMSVSSAVEIMSSAGRAAENANQVIRPYRIRQQLEATGGRTETTSA